MAGVEETQVLQEEGGEKLPGDHQGEGEKRSKPRRQDDHGNHVHRSKKPSHIHPRGGLEHPAPGPGGPCEEKGQKEEGQGAHGEGDQGRAHRPPHHPGELGVDPRLQGEDRPR